VLSGLYEVLTGKQKEELVQLTLHAITLQDTPALKVMQQIATSIIHEHREQSTSLFRGNRLPIVLLSAFFRAAGGHYLTIVLKQSIGAVVASTNSFEVPFTHSLTHSLTHSHAF